MNQSSVTISPLSRSERRRERTRQELVVAATRVLAEKGFHDTKIADIASAADLGVGTFYLYFPTKDALFDAVVEETVGRLKATVDAARATATDPVQRLRAANAAFCRFAGENREVFRIVFGHAAAYSDVIRRAQEAFAADIEENLREGIASGAFAPVPVEAAAQATVGMATQMLSWWTEHESIPLDTVEQTIITLSLTGLRPAAAPRGVPHV